MSVCGHPVSETETCTLPEYHGPDAFGNWMHGHPGGSHCWADLDWFVEHNTRIERTNLPRVCIHCEAHVADATKHLVTTHNLTPYLWGNEKEVRQ